MTIGTALVIIAILYLIDKHNLWKKAVAVCLVALAITLLGFAGYYGWQKWQQRKVQAKAEKELESQWQVVSGGPSLPNGYVLENVSEAILYPLKADDEVKAAARAWYSDSSCAIVGSSTPPTTHVLHKDILFSFDSYDPAWMRDIALPPEMKRALWNAKVAECRLHPGEKLVKACLDRATGAVDVGPWVQYMTSCEPKREMVYLNSEPEAKEIRGRPGHKAE
jgi:hypothetical protein